VAVGPHAGGDKRRRARSQSPPESLSARSAYAIMFDRHFVIVELANILAGPITSMYFAELGARVIKIENPHTRGDATRGWRTLAEDPAHDVSSYFSCANWGKESIALDTSTTAGLEVAHELCARADIVTASFKPGDAAKLRLDHPTLAARNPRLIYGQINAYGEDDPRPGFDAIVQAEAGFTFLNGETDGPPTKMPVALVDLLAAHQLKEALLLALLKRERTGAGSFVSVSLLQAAVASLANQATNYLVGGSVPRRMGSEHPNIVPYGTILTGSDGRGVVLAAATERQYRDFVKAIGLPELADDPDFQTTRQRVARRDELLARVRARTSGMSSAELAAVLGHAMVPYGFVNDMAAVFEQPAAQALVMHGSANGKALRGVHSCAFTGDAATLVEPAPPPSLNEHAPAILGDFLGYDGGKIAALGAAGAFGRPA
jgi:crotonobetainyl-CoA:carnitine CoA-transferase CaiB-like acyl-CoA transferase